MLRLYERWARTGSAPLAEALAGRGLTRNGGMEASIEPPEAARAFCRIQRRLEGYYALERAPSVTRFVREGDLGSREVVLVRESNDELEIAVVLPPESRKIPAGGAAQRRLVASRGRRQPLHLSGGARAHGACQ